MPSFDSLLNHGEYFATHYFAEQLDEALRTGLFKTWTGREGDEHAGEDRETPRLRLPRLRAGYFDGKVRTYFAERASLEAEEHDTAYTYGDPEWRARIAQWHRRVLTALGFSVQTENVELTAHHAGRDHTVRAAYRGPGVVALDCGWASGFDGLLAADGPARLLEPLRISSTERYEDGAGLASFLLHAEEVDGAEPPRFIVLLLGGVIVLADKRSFGEGRYLAANLDAALPRSRTDSSKTGELSTIAALLCRDMLEPAENGEGPLLDALLEGSTRNAVGVADELRDGLREAVELIANEVLARLEQAHVDPRRLGESLRLTDPREFARQLTCESLRYLYRILFLLYAEARPELGILPADDDAYEAGYSIARLRELVARDERLIGEHARAGFHLYESLDLLFRKVNEGHRPFGTEPGDSDSERRSEDRGLRFEQLNSDLFAPDAVTLIGRTLAHPDADEDDPHPLRLDTRLRNETLHRVLRRLTLTAGRKGPRGKRERGGFISYRNLGINQLGAVYEGLMSYTGFIADEELYEVAKKSDIQKGHVRGGSWMVPASRIGQYPDEVFVTYPADDPERRTGRKRYKKGQFVYRLSGRDRQTSASYYTPESLTKLTVELALRELAGQGATAAQILQYKICEPALGSGAFLNEAINQVAGLYLSRRQEELGRTIPTSTYLEEFQKAKAYIALHNSYGVDLNATAVELAEVSLWLNTMHPGMRAPWYGLHLRRGNSLIGGRRVVYSAEDVVGDQWTKASKTLAPTELPFLKDGAGQALPEGAVHQFLLPAAGWAAVARETDASKLEPELAKQLTAWRRRVVKAPSAKAVRGKKSQLERLQGLARRAEFLWRLVATRIELSEAQIARKIDVWGARPEGDENPELFAFLKQPENPVPKETVYADLFEAIGTPYWRLKLLMDTWCALWFWPLDKAGLLDGTDEAYETEEAAPRFPDFVLEARNEAWRNAVVEQPVLFGFEQGTLTTVEDSDELPATELKVGGAAKKASGRGGSKPQRRARIAVKDLTDWIDFAECLLGQDDVPEDSLLSEFPTLGVLRDYEDSLPATMGMDTEFALNTRFPWLDAVQDIATEQGFFHWELAFAHTFVTNGGFDLQMGNPPWVRPDWREDLVLAEFDPWFALTEKAPAREVRVRRDALLEAAKPRRGFLYDLTTTSTFAAYFAGESTYPLIAGTRPDLYRCFIIRVLSSLNGNGSAGLVHPGTHFSGRREGRLRAMVYRSLRFHAHFTNERKIFTDIDYHVPFGLHIYGRPRNIHFTHVCWLFEPSTLKGSLEHSGHDELPGVKYKGTWDIRPHQSRLITVDDDVLAEWAAFVGDDNGLLHQTPLLYPVTAAEADAISAMAKIGHRLGAMNPWISHGLDEKGAKDNHQIEWNTSMVSDWAEVIIQGPYFGVATPLSKQPNIPCKSNKDYEPWDLTMLPHGAIPRTNYRRSQALSLDDFKALQSARNGSRQVDHYRLMWRAMISQSSVRSLFPAIFPPGPTHVDAVRGLVHADTRMLALVAGMWSGIPLDYYLRITDAGHLHETTATFLPAPTTDHPLAEQLLIRTVRLNCLTTAYADLWCAVFNEEWKRENWAVQWPRLTAQSLGAVTSKWAYETPLRTEYERRAALVEIDALVSVWLGITVEQFMAIYNARFGVLASYEADMYFDANGRQITREYYGQGVGQGPSTYADLMNHLSDPEKVAPPTGYAAPFYRADREREMREGYAVFKARLDEAIARGEWDPVKQEVPKR
jgi:hypothetical protein